MDGEEEGSVKEEADSRLAPKDGQDLHGRGEQGGCGRPGFPNDHDEGKAQVVSLRVAKREAGCVPGCWASVRQ